MAMSAEPPNTRLMPTRRPSADAALEAAGKRPSGPCPPSPRNGPCNARRWRSSGPSGRQGRKPGGRRRPKSLVSRRRLANNGRNPSTGFAIVSKKRARRINALMLTCGHYDGSGDFAFRVGLPGKSGIGGGILAIVPGQASIAVWSPGLNAHGNSLVGTLALEAIAQETSWSVFSR
jgi:Glutaminase